LLVDILFELYIFLIKKSLETQKSQLHLTSYVFDK